MSKHVALNYYMSSEDMFPTFNFFVYDDGDDIVTIDVSEGRIKSNKKKPKLSLEQMDQMTEEEINEWYESHDRSHISD